MTCAFTEAHYCEIIRGFQGAGYRFSGFADFRPGASHQVILRHDVDLSLEEALRLARLDAYLAVNSVFHVLLTAEVYNPSSAAGQAALQAIRSLGHRIGLHVDLAALGDGRWGEATLAQRLRALFDAARHALGPLDSYSLHRPAVNGGADGLQPSRLAFATPPYAYESTYAHEIPYRSDSRREWYEACICTELPRLAGRSLQLVLHPIWWPPIACTRAEVLQHYLQQQQHLADNYLAGNLSFYPPEARPEVMAAS